jgi:hypothetical protein
MIVDESHYIVSPSGGWARCVRRLAQQTVPWVRLLSGTPAPNHYGNLWGQLAALNPDEFGWSYKAFADRWLILNPVFPSQVDGYRDLDTLEPLLKAYCSFKRRDEVFGPDDWITNVVEVDMPPQASRQYARLAREWLIDDPDDNLLVEAGHILTRMTRLQQLASGYLVDDTTGDERLVHTAKLDVCVADHERLIAAGEKAVIFHRFRWEGRELEARLRGKCRLLVINGDVSAEQRDEVQRAIEEDAGPIIAIVQTQSGGIGVSYRNAAYCSFFSQSFSFVQEEQARDRIYVPGSPRFVTWYRTMGTVDEFIAERLELKLTMHDNLTRIDRSEIAFGSYTPKRIKLKKAQLTGPT